ncbi:MAG: serpin family protein, partial [Marinilabiliales bacterium]
MRRLIIFLILALIMNVSKAQTTSSIGNNEFSFDLFKRVSQTEGNQVISPFSISSALAMTYAGARNETESEISQVMHFDK